MKKETHISEFTAKKGKGLHIRVTTTKNKKRIAVDGGRLYYSDFSTKYECMKTAKEIRDGILRDLQTHPTVNAPTVSDLYAKSFELFPVALSTKTEHDRVYDHFIEQYGNVPITKLSLQDVQMSVNRFAEKYAQERIKRLIVIWKRIYKTAFFCQVPVVDLSQMIIVPRSKVVKKEKDMTMTSDDFDKMIGFLSDSLVWKSKVALPLIWVLYYTGMRPAEALALTVNDIDIRRSIIHVRKQIGSTVTKTSDVVPLKTASSRRDIPIADGLLPVLETLTEDADGLLFKDPDGDMVTPIVISQYVSHIAHYRNINFSLYRIRHMFSADLFRNGINPKVIQSLMGHKHDTMSLYYAYTTENDRVIAVQKRKPS